MEIKSQFSVPLSPQEAWRVLMDIPRIAPCMPGTELLEQIDERTFKGKVSLKLGPVALAFVGTANFEMIDDQALCARANAKGNDAKGRGGASAKINFKLLPCPEGTSVEVLTDVNLVGSVAQYGRAAGVIQTVATQIVNQFAENLKASLSTQTAGTETEPSGATQALKGSAPARAPANAPISAFGLFVRVLKDMLLRLVGKSVT